MSLFGPVTNTDRRRWQLARARLLGRLLEDAYQAGLPPLDWTVSVHALIGRASSLPGEDPEGAWQAWTQALSATPAPARHSTGGVRHLRSCATRVHDMADVILLATSTPDTEPDDLPDHDQNDDRNDAVPPSGGRT